MAFPALATKLNDPELRNLAAATMARIGTVEARDLLRKYRVGADEETGRFLDALLREEFSRGS